MSRLPAADPAVWPPRRRALGAAVGLAAPLLLPGCALAPGALPGAAGDGPAGGAAGGATGGPTGDEPPPAPREFRGAWVATVAHIDWPSRPGLKPEQQRAEALALIDKAAALGLNALLLQVRPAADALYPSAIEPWSELLTGTQGRAPEDGHDPLAFWLAETRRRGLQLHAWLNPYRARPSSAKSAPAASHISQRRPELVRRYGDQLWIDPAEPAAAAQLLAVVDDLLARYALDGIHIDDYFYPYPVTNAAGVELPFPDDAPWLRYLQAGGGLARADWRRAQVDQLVQALHQAVRRGRPGARFGVSPFGLPQPALRPPGITGFSQYDKLYADVERWLREGWMDYCAPQLYWPLDRGPQAFEPLLDAWLGEALNPRGLALWPGLYTSMVGAAAKPWAPDELLAQVDRVRRRPAAGGHIHFSLQALAKDREGLATRLRAGPYAEPALVPVAPLPEALVPLHTPAPPRLQAAAEHGWLLLPGPAPVRAGPGAAGPEPAAEVAHWAVWRRVGGHWRFALQRPAQRLLLAEGADRLVVSAVGRFGHESARVRAPAIA